MNKGKRIEENLKPTLENDDINSVASVLSVEEERNEVEEPEDENKANKMWKGMCLDDGTGRNVVYYDFKTKVRSRVPPDNYIEERFENGNRRYYYRGVCIRCRSTSPCVFFTLQQGQYGVSTNYCEKCLISTTLGMTRIKRNGDLIWQNHSDIPCNTYINLQKHLLDPNREEQILHRSREASFHVKTIAKYYRNMDRLRSMKIIALQQDIYGGKLVSWGFGKHFDEYYGPVDTSNRPDGTRGIKIYSDGSVYIGGWLKGLRHHIEGNAVWTRPDGLQYEGTWMNDLKHGTGKQRYPDSTTYVGEWAQGFEHGNGIKTYLDGSRYEGRFRFGKRDGPGTVFHANGSVDKGIYKDNQTFHETLLPKIEDEETDAATVIFQPDSLLLIAIRAVAMTMKTKRSLVPNHKIHSSLQPFFQPLIAKEYLINLHPLGSKEFIENAPSIAFQHLTIIQLNYVKFKHFDMESFIYFTSMNSSLQRLELMNNRMDPTSIDMINTQMRNKVWPSLQIIDFSFNKIDTTGITNFLIAIQKGTNCMKCIKLSGCNINSTGAQAIARFLEETTTVEDLDISFNSIQVAGAEYIANALTVNKSLTSLNLRQNNIGSIGGEALMKAMQSNFQICVLCVADNKISREIAVAIAGRLRGSTKDVIESFRANQLAIPSIHLEKHRREFH